MSAIFVDANVLLRFLTSDDQAQQAVANAFFKRAVAANIELVTGPPVLFEVAWTLRTGYGVPRTQVLDKLESIVGIPNLRLTDAVLVQDALSLARRANVDFADAYIAVLAKSAGADEVATFDTKHFSAMGVKAASLATR